MTIEWLAGNRLRGTTAERPALSMPSGSVGGWVELARTTLGSAGDTLAVSSFANKRYYMVLYNSGVSTELTQYTTFGSGGSADTGSNYSNRVSGNGAGDSSFTSRANMVSGAKSGATRPEFGVGYISNLASKEKLWIHHAVNEHTAGAGTAPDRNEVAGKWSNTSNALDVVSFNNFGTGDFPIGAEAVVLGWDPADTHTTNFWEELGSDTGDGASDDLTVSGITAKKYLWIQFYVDPDASWTPRMRFNSDTGSNYCDRYNINGGTDGTDLNSTGTYPGFGGGLPQLYNIFMINNSANEKLGISQNVYQGTAGAGTAPERGETALKWSNTSAQITTIAIDALAGTPNLSTKSYLKVWGSD